jgi:quercetin dioxygenase-like cupin family protein
LIRGDCIQFKELISIKTQTQNIIMKKIALLFTLPLVLSLIALAAEEKESAKHSTKTKSSESATTEHIIVTPADLKWVDAPPGLPPGAKMAVLEGDPTKKGSFTLRMQAPAGYKVPPHTHPTTEHITVISGALHLGMGEKFDETAGQELAAGSYAVMPAGMKHFAWSPGETVLQIHGKGPFEINYLNPADDPRNTKK